MLFRATSPRTRAARPEVVTTTREPRREGFMSRLLRPGPAVRESHDVTRRHRREPVVERRSRIGFRSRRAEPVREVIEPHHQHRRPSFGDKIHGFGKKIVGSLTGRPAKKAAGTKMLRGTDGRSSRRRRRYL